MPNQTENSESRTSAIIAKQNDAFRKFPFAGGKFMMTRGVSAFMQEHEVNILPLVQDFNDFNENNDPYGEHDYGSFTIKDEKIMWKIDYYDAASNYKYGSEDASNSSITRRVLTIMLADEY